MFVSSLTPRTLFTPILPRSEDPASYRDLSKPVGALAEKRLKYFRERMAGMPENQDGLGRVRGVAG